MGGERDIKGMHVCNTRAWDIEQMLRCAPGCVTILHHMMFPEDKMVGQWGDIENAYWYNKLRWGWPAQGIPAAPERLIHVRLFQPNWRDYTPEAIARQAVTLLSSWRYEGQSANLWDDPFVGVSPCNEQNLEDANHPATDWWALTPAQRGALLEERAAWQLRFWDEIDRLLPRRRAVSVLGALAYGGDWQNDVPDSEYTHPRWRELCRRVDVLATHPYCHLEWANGSDTAPGGKDAYYHLLRDFRPAGWRDTREPNKPHDPGGLLAQVPGKPLLITETGTFTHSDPSRTAETVAALRLLYETAAKSGRVLGITPFIWNADSSHPTNAIWPNPELRNALERLPDFVTTCRVPVRGQQPMPPNPAPNPEPITPAPSPAPIVSGLVAGLYVLRGDGWTAIARRMLGREPTSAEWRHVQATNGGGGVPAAGNFVRSPWHVASRRT